MVGWWTIPLALVLLTGDAASQSYYGKRLGSIRTLEHGVSGDVYAVDSRTLHIRNLNYDGQGPDAFFYLGSGSVPTGRGYKIPDENGSMEPLRAYRNQAITLTLPSGVTLDEIQWISVWCRAFSVDFGNLVLPAPITEYPRPQRIGRLKTLEHDVSSGDIVVVDAQTLLVPDFTYDGTAPDAHFWVGKGSKPSPSGQVVADENGSKAPLRGYNRKTVVITLPSELTVFDIDYLSVWCEDFFADFGHVRIDKASLNVPPSLKMLGVKPQTKLNCEVLDSDSSMEVRWAVAGESIVMQLVSSVEDGQYMSFGLSGAPTRSVMIGGDVVVAWLDRTTGQGYAHDYYLQAKSQCAGGRGSCPDTKIGGGKNGVRLLNSALINGFSMLTFQRPLAAGDGFDQEILTNSSQAVIWAIGPVNSAGETSYHSKRTRGNMLLDFGRTPQWNCAVASSSSSSSSSRPRPATTKAPATVKPWTIPAVKCDEPKDRVFYAQIGPTGGARGYSAITGRVGWGIAWYINGLLVPEINVVRGQTYTFVVEGGLDPERSAKYHPFYITDDPEGGYEFKSPTEQKSVRVFAGISLDSQGKAQPTATGRLCSWKENPSQPADTHGSFGAYQRTLQLDCEEGQPGILQWTPDADTPDTVYYQCFTHRYLGWKINVVDSCESGETDYDDADYFYEDSLPQPSVAVEQTVANSVPYTPTYPSGEQSYPVQYDETPETNQVDLGPSTYVPESEYAGSFEPQRFESQREEVPEPGAEYSDFDPAVLPPPPPPPGAGEKMNVALVPHGVPVPPELGPGFFGPPPEGVPLPPFERRPPPPREPAPDRRRLPTNRRGTAPVAQRRPVKQQRRRPAPELQRRRSDTPARREPLPPLPGNGVVFGRPLADAERPHQLPQHAAFQAPPPGHKFDAHDIVLETDFIPVQDSDRNNPPLAFDATEEARWQENAVSKKTGEQTNGFAPSSWGQRTQPRPVSVARPQPVSIPLPEAVVPLGPSQTADRREASPEPAVASLPSRPPPPPQQTVTHQETPTYQPQRPEYQQQQPTFQQQGSTFQQQGSTFQQQQQGPPTQHAPIYQQQTPSFQQQPHHQQPQHQQHHQQHHQQQQQGPSHHEQQSSSEEQPPTFLQPAPPLAEGVPLPPHLTEDILPGAVVFRPDEDPRAAIAAAKNRLRNQPGRRQQQPQQQQYQQQQQYRPAPAQGLLSGPASFLSGLLGYIPGLGGAGRRRAPLGRGANTNPHRLLEVSREKHAGPHAMPETREQPQPRPQEVRRRPGVAVPPPPQQQQQQFGGIERRTVEDASPIMLPEMLSERIRAVADAADADEAARRLTLPIVPEMQPMFERQPFQPSPLDGASFRPVSEQPQLAEVPAEPAGDDTLTSAEVMEETTQSAQGAGARQAILEDVWRRMRVGAESGDRRKRHATRRDAR